MAVVNDQAGAKTQDDRGSVEKSIVRSRPDARGAGTQGGGADAGSPAN